MKYNSGMLKSFNWLIIEFELCCTGLTSNTVINLRNAIIMWLIAFTFSYNQQGKKFNLCFVLLCVLLYAMTRDVTRCHNPQHLLWLSNNAWFSLDATLPVAEIFYPQNQWQVCYGCGKQGYRWLKTQCQPWWCIVSLAYYSSRYKILKYSPWVQRTCTIHSIKIIKWVIRNTLSTYRK